MPVIPTNNTLLVFKNHPCWKTLVAGIFLGFLCTRILISISRTQNDLYKWNEVYNNPAMDLPEEQQQLQKNKRKNNNNNNTIASPKKLQINKNTQNNNMADDKDDNDNSRIPKVPVIVEKPNDSDNKKELETHDIILDNDAKTDNVQAKQEIMAAEDEKKPANQQQQKQQQKIITIDPSNNNPEKKSLLAKKLTATPPPPLIKENNNHSGNATTTTTTMNFKPIDNTSMTYETYQRLVAEHAKMATLAGPPYDFNFSAPPILNRSDIVDFERQPGVVIATKIHGYKMIFILEQCLCLLHHSYNHRVLYDIIVFSTTPVSDELLAPVRQMIAPSKLTLVVDNPGLQEMIQSISPLRRRLFLERCNEADANITHFDNITWWSNCPHRLAYNWQAEFRSWHIWRNPALAPYKYMLWLDTDGFGTMPWEKDPVAYMIRNDLVILFSNYPQGKAKDPRVHDRVWKYFGKTICNVKLQQGHLHAEIQNSARCVNKTIKDIHGFFHITNLDFYRSDYVYNFEEAFIGDCFLCRKFDDQAAVTIPAVILAEERSHDMRRNGLRNHVFHNFYLDGKKYNKVGGFFRYWKHYGRHNLTSARDVCPIVAGS